MVTSGTVQASLESKKENTKSFSLADLSRNSTLTTNVEQDCIVTTRDKIELILTKYEKAKRLTNWWQYLSMFLTFLVPLITADFHDFIGIEGEFISALFVLLAVASAILTIVSIAKSLRNKEKATIEYCANSIKKGTFSE